jgi:hypothetical protein
MTAQTPNQPDYWQNVANKERRRADANLRLAAERAQEIGELLEQIKGLEEELGELRALRAQVEELKMDLIFYEVLKKHHRKHHERYGETDEGETPELDEELMEQERMLSTSRLTLELARKTAWAAAWKHVAKSWRMAHREDCLALGEKIANLERRVEQLKNNARISEHRI